MKQLRVVQHTTLAVNAALALDRMRERRRMAVFALNPVRDGN